MYGALLGDMIGAPYEFDRGGKTKEFPLFCMQFTGSVIVYELLDPTYEAF